MEDPSNSSWGSMTRPPLQTLVPVTHYPPPTWKAQYHHRIQASQSTGRVLGAGDRDRARGQHQLPHGPRPGSCLRPEASREKGSPAPREKQAPERAGTQPLFFSPHNPHQPPLSSRGSMRGQPAQLKKGPGTAALPPALFSQPRAHTPRTL